MPEGPVLAGFLAVRSFLAFPWSLRPLCHSVFWRPRRLRGWRAIAAHPKPPRVRADSKAPQHSEVCPQPLRNALRGTVRRGLLARSSAPRAPFLALLGFVGRGDARPASCSPRHTLFISARGTPDAERPGLPRAPLQAVAPKPFTRVERFSCAHIFCLWITCGKLVDNLGITRACPVTESVCPQFVHRLSTGYPPMARCP